MLMDECRRALSALQTLDPGCAREQWVRIGMAAKAAGLTLEDFTHWSSAAHNYASERDCAKVWESFGDGPVRAGTLYRMAFDEGWSDPAKSGKNGHDKRQAFIRTADPIRAQKTAPRGAIGPSDAAVALWERCEPATDLHAYIIAKCGRPDGLRVVPAGDSLTIAGHAVAGWLVVPAVSLAGELRTVQLIPPPGIGTKLNMPGASFADGLFAVGGLGQSPRILIVEGIGQAWACGSATGCAAVVCFGAGRMATVAELLRSRFPSLPLLLVPDRGKELQAAEIARAIRGEWVELPNDKPANYDANDYAQEHGAEALADLLHKPKAPAMRYRVLSAGELMELPPLRWLVRGVVPLNGLACIYGASGSGKSFLALDMCAAVADGREWFDCRVTAAPVVYVALEGEHGFRQRVKAWQVHHGRAVPGLLRFVMQPLDMRKSDDVAELAAAVIASGGAGGAGGLLVIDTLNRAASGADENSSTDMGQLIDAAKVLQSQLGWTVLLIHHSGKDAAKGLRGHSSLHAALDAAIEVWRTDDRREWRIAKSKDDDDSAAHPFRLQVVELERDEHGELVTSCAVVPDDARVEFRRALPPKSGNMRVILDALGELLRKAGDVRPADAPTRLPHGRPAVRLDCAIEVLRDRLACDPKRKTERTRQALTGLQARGLVLIDGGYVWTA